MSGYEPSEDGHDFGIDIMDSLILLLKPFNQSRDLFPERGSVLEVFGGLFTLLGLNFLDNLQCSGHQFLSFLEIIDGCYA